MVYISTISANYCSFNYINILNEIATYKMKIMIALPPIVIGNDKTTLFVRILLTIVSCSFFMSDQPQMIPIVKLNYINMHNKMYALIPTKD